VSASLEKPRAATRLTSADDEGCGITVLSGAGWVSAAAGNAASIGATNAPREILAFNLAIGVRIRALTSAAHA
jgi:hypothetical protein